MQKGDNFLSPCALQERWEWKENKRRGFQEMETSPWITQQPRQSQCPLLRTELPPFNTLQSKLLLSLLPSQRVLSTQVQQRKLTQPPHIDLYILYIRAPSSFSTALMEFPRAVSFSLPPSIYLHHHPALSGGRVSLKAVRLEWWDERRGGGGWCLCARISCRGRATEASLTVAAHNTTALLLVEATHTDSRLCGSVQEERMLMSVYGSTSLQSSLGVAVPARRCARTFVCVHCHQSV